MILAPEAEEDVAEAYAWYEQQRVGLGKDFLSSVDARFQVILREPEMNSMVVEDYRRCLLRRFPYAIYYEHLGSTVMVYFTPLEIRVSGVIVCLEFKGRTCSKGINERKILCSCANHCFYRNRLIKSGEPAVIPNG